MQKQSMHVSLLAAILIFAGSCAVTDLDRTANFNEYRTFAWGEPENKVDNPVYNSELIDRNIKSTVEKEFLKRGIVENKSNPDFIVRYRTHTEEKQETYGTGYHRPVYFYSPFLFYPYAYAWGMPYMFGSVPRTYTYTSGTLIIDIIDKQTEALVWRGSVKGNVEQVSNLERQIEKGIKAIMKKYPVTPGERLRLPDADVIG
jgi:hypothetical protein